MDPGRQQERVHRKGPGGGPGAGRLRRPPSVPAAIRALLLPLLILTIAGAAEPPLPSASGLAAPPGRGAGQASPSPSFCEPEPGEADLRGHAALGLPDRELHCIDLLPVEAAAGARGVVELAPASSPFGISVDRNGVPVHDFVFRLEELPEPSSLGPYETFVAWIASPTLEPVERLGEVSAGETRLGPAGMNAFLILISAEAGPDVEERRGPLVLRGVSPGFLLRPHDLPYILAEMAPAGGHEERTEAPAGEEPDAPESETRHRGHGIPLPAPEGPVRWSHPPMHPEVEMPERLMALRPEVRPFLPSPPEGAEVARARPREMVPLADGDSIELVAGPVLREILGRTHVMYGFNGQYPGPLIRVEEEATVVVGFRNETDIPSSVHWHGIRLYNAYDGVPFVTQDPVPPGGSFRYELHFPDPGIYWYHPHVREDVAQDLGLYGNLSVASADPEYYGPASREEFLMLDDLLLGDEGIVPYGLEAPIHALMGRFGNLLLVNGEPEYRLEVDGGEVVRFHLTNASNTRTFNLSFGGAATKVVASDVGRFEKEAWVESVVIAPAERYVVEVRFPQAGTFPMANRVQALDHMAARFFPEVDTLGVVEVGGDRVGEDQDHGAAFDSLRVRPGVAREIAELEPHLDRPVDLEMILTLRLGELPFPLGPLLRYEGVYRPPVEWAGTMPEMDWLATGRSVEWILRDPATGRENMEIDWRFRVGDVVKIRIVNDRDSFHPMQHPIHIHGQRFLVLSRNGVPNRNRVWKDTFLVPVGSTAEILLELSNPGRWMVHCHIAEHIETGMMTVFTVDP